VLVLPAAVLRLTLMLEHGPERRQVVDGLAQHHHPRLARRWIRARGAIGAAEDAQLQALLLATRRV
jgi:hypothetical protein